LSESEHPASNASTSSSTHTRDISTNTYTNTSTNTITNTNTSKDTNHLSKSKENSHSIQKKNSTAKISKSTDNLNNNNNNNNNSNTKSNGRRGRRGTITGRLRKISLFIKNVNTGNSNKLNKDGIDNKIEVLDLIKLSIDEKVFIKLKGDREIRGILHAYDQHLNLVVGNAEEIMNESIYDENLGEEVTKSHKRTMDMIFLRGDNVILVSPPPLR
jgi:U6 snRNA-associated Sm-like protein LSm3